jgi:hypothetical protein
MSVYMKSRDDEDGMKRVIYMNRIFSYVHKRLSNAQFIVRVITSCVRLFRLIRSLPSY